MWISVPCLQKADICVACTDKQKDKFRMICSGKDPNVLICVYGILVSTRAKSALLRLDDNA